MSDRLSPQQYDTLDGVPEPAESLSVIGHSDQITATAGAYRAGKLPHALILAGPRGIGKATFAFNLAHHLLANRDPLIAPAAFSPRDPQSSLFRQIASGAHPSVLHLTRPANDRGTGFKSVISVDEVRRISRFLSMTSHDGGYRIIIIDPAEELNRNAANALLKNLEEPPSRTVFLLLTHAPGSLLPTIRSRCQIVRFEPLPDDEVLAVMARFETAAPDDDTRRQLIDRAAGSPRTAVLLSEYGGGEIASAMQSATRKPNVDVSEAHRLADAVAGRDQGIQFSLFNVAALDMLADAARNAAVEGNIDRAEKLADVYEKSQVAILETDTYNLDRKQHALSMINRLHDAFRM